MVDCTLYIAHCRLPLSSIYNVQCAIYSFMYFLHTPDIWREFPQLVPGLLLVEGIDPSAEVAARLEPFHRRAAGRLSAGAESDLPEVQAWRRAYAQMGMKPTQYRSAAEALLRRFRREGSLPQLHPL